MNIKKTFLPIYLFILIIKLSDIFSLRLDPLQSCSMTYIIKLSDYWTISIIWVRSNMLKKVWAKLIQPPNLEVKTLSWVEKMLNMNRKDVTCWYHTAMKSWAW